MVRPISSCFSNLFCCSSPAASEPKKNARYGSVDFDQSEPPPHNDMSDQIEPKTAPPSANSTTDDDVLPDNWKI